MYPIIFYGKTYYFRHIKLSIFHSFSYYLKYILLSLFIKLILTILKFISVKITIII